jgi:pimeloyl-ACP methyl ester carboxylesterase
VTEVSPGGIWSAEAGDVDAPLLALVHGSMDRSAGLLKLSRRLDGRCRVLRYDRRGYGRSAPHDGPFGMDAQVTDLVDVLADRPAVIFGHSYGGNVALALAERHPDLVRAVGVYETPLPWLEWWPDSTAGSQANPSHVGSAPDEAAERFMRRMIGDQRWERLPSRTRNARRAEGVAMIGELVDIDEHAPWDPAHISVPAVSMRGSDGRSHHRRSSDHLHAVLADCPIVTIEGARHFGPNTHPDAVAAVLTDLVSRAAAPR